MIILNSTIRASRYFIFFSEREPHGESSHKEDIEPSLENCTEVAVGYSGIDRYQFE
jgi:hypothetical protein